MRYKSARTLRAVTKAWPGCHVEVARNAPKAWAYCIKDDTRVAEPITFGDPPTTTSTEKSHSVLNKRIINEPIESLVLDGTIPFSRYIGILRAKELYQLKTRTYPTLSTLANEWHYGPPGCGKSSGVRTSFPDHYQKPINKWWDGYNAEGTVILDDFGEEHKCLGYYLKIWADHFPFTAETKGGTVRLRPERIVVTSNLRPADIWESTTLLAIERRFRLIDYNNLN